MHIFHALFCLIMGGVVRPSSPPISCHSLATSTARCACGADDPGVDPELQAMSNQDLTDPRGWIFLWFGSPEG